MSSSNKIETLSPGGSTVWNPTQDRISVAAVLANQAVALRKLDLLVSFLLVKYQAAAGLTLDGLRDEIAAFITASQLDAKSDSAVEGPKVVV